jgi:hypothetical protein
VVFEQLPLTSSELQRSFPRAVDGKAILMARVRSNTVTEKIFENIVFLAEVFGDYPDKDIPDVPVLELAKCFELSHPRLRRRTRRHKPWPLWK